MIDLLTDFIASRSEQKKPMTDRAIKMLEKKLSRYPVAIQEAALERALIGGWSGVFPESEKAAKSNSSRDLSLGEMLNDREWAR